MPKHRKKNNQGCCLVSLFLLPFKLLESLINAITGQPAVVRTPPASRRIIQNIPQRQSQPQRERFVAVSPAGTHRAAQPPVAITISYEDSRTTFVNDAQKFRSVEGEVASPALFMHYWPTYRDMNSVQQRWYFYWRTQARKGSYLPTDLSYIFVHVYEILNLVEMPDPVQAANRIQALWLAYRKTYAQLDRYLPEWGGDLLAVKVDGAHALTWWEDVLKVDGIAVPDPVLNVIVEKAIRTNGTDKLPYKIWTLLSDYQPRNKFYQTHNSNHEIDGAYEKAIRVANSFYLRTSQKSMIDQFVSDQIYTYEKSVFTSAVIGRSDQKAIRLASGRNYAGSIQLANAITSIMKYAENLLRKQLKVSAKLSGVEIPADLAKELDRAFLPAKPKQEPVRISLDPSRVAALHKESQEVSALLTTESENTEKPLLTDLAEVRTLWTGLNSLERKIIAGITKGDLKSVDNVEQVLALQAMDASSLIERINSQALVVLGDRLVYISNKDLSLAEDFLDELDVVVRETPDEQGVTTTDGIAVSNSWLQVFDHLDPAEAEILKLLGQRGSLAEAEIDGVARTYNMIGSVVLDSLNEKALDRLGHLPIFLNGEEWSVEEDDLPILREHLGLEVNQS